MLGRTFSFVAFVADVEVKQRSRDLNYARKSIDFHSLLDRLSYGRKRECSNHASYKRDNTRPTVREFDKRGRLRGLSERCIIHENEIRTAANRANDLSSCY